MDRVKQELLLVVEKEQVKTFIFSQFVPDTVMATTQLAAHTLPLSYLLKKRL